jgi:hypothetical protein
MDRISSKPAIVADALRLIAAPACACDAMGVVVAANAEMTALAGRSPKGRLLLDLFRGEAAHGRIELEAAIRAASGSWRGTLSVRGAHLAVEVRSKPLAPSAARLARPSCSPTSAPTNAASRRCAPP